MSEFADGAGRYRLESRIATGGMGEVWRATDTMLGRQVAIKLLKTEYADDATFRSRFETEAQHAAALQHPGIAAVYDVGESAPTDGSGHPRPYLVMELVEGQPLSNLIGAHAGGRELDPDAVRDLLAQVGDALGAAHRAGIVHRDVKPANLLVTPDGKIKVTDFGIARAADGVGITRTGAVMGTPQYLSPEQAEGKQATSASDVYSLGVVAFECLAGRRPFEADSPVATALAHLREPIPELPASVPDDLAVVVRRALSKDPAERYADGAAFAAALRNPSAAAASTPPLGGPVVPPVADTAATQVLGATPYDPTPTPATAQLGGTSGPAVPAGPVGPDETDKRRNPWPIIAAVVLVVALAVVLTMLLTGGDDDEDPSAGDTTTSQSRTRTPSKSETSTDDGPQTKRVNESAYVGKQVDEVESALRGLGFDVRRESRENSDASRDGEVTAVNPNGDVEVGETITVTYWADAPEETSEPPSSEPTTTEPPTTEPTTTEPPTTEPTSSEPTTTEPPTSPTEESAP
ncbi:protein kinase domain-containing protein [Nocardioides sp. GXZ039]|uniref:protein kinase domain-containing protein n=1 Tax=Nocardioides sp. GXZ039 TaxID=3136018 RepID=UPI0030F4392E